MSSVQILAWVALAINVICAIATVNNYFKSRRYTRQAKQLIDEIEKEFYPKKLRFKLVKGDKNDPSDNIAS